VKGSAIDLAGARPATPGSGPPGRECRDRLRLPERVHVNLVIDFARAPVDRRAKAWRYGFARTKVLAAAGLTLRTRRRAPQLFDRTWSSRGYRAAYEIGDLPPVRLVGAKPE